MGPSQSLVQLHSFQDLELPQPWTARKRPKGVSTLGTGHHEVNGPNNLTSLVSSNWAQASLLSSSSPS